MRALSALLLVLLFTPTCGFCIDAKSIAGNWNGKVRADGADLFVSFDATQTGNKIEGTLSANDGSGVSKHFVEGEYNESDKTFHLHDTKVEKVSGLRKFAPVLMDDYVLKLNTKGTVLAGSCIPESGKKRIVIKLVRKIEADSISSKEEQDPNNEHSREYMLRTRSAFELGEQAKKLVVTEKYAEAEAIYRKAVQLDPNRNSASIHCDLGVVLEMQHKYQEAMDEFGKAIQLESCYPTAIFNLATCYLNSGNTEEAKTRFTSFLKDYPNAADRVEAARLLDLLNNPNKQDTSTGNLKPTIVAAKPPEKYIEPEEEQKVILPDGKEADQMDAASDDYVGKVADYYSSAIRNGTYRWRKEDLPIKVYIESGEGVTGYRKEFREQLIESLDDWMQASQQRLSWQLVPKKEEAKLVCTWISDKKQFLLQKFLEQGETHLQGYYTPKGDELGFIQSATIMICTSSVLGIKPLTVKDIRQVCRHEVGHALGLYGHSPHRKDVMYPTATGVFSVKDLTASDVETLNRLYAFYPISTASSFVVRGGES